MKNPPKLTLLQQSKDSINSNAVDRSIELLSFEELNIEEQNQVYRDFDNSYIQGSILAVAKFEKNNKLAPVIVSNRENAPSIIRYVDNSENILPILAEKFSQLNQLEKGDNDYFALNWGISTNRFWYRKPLVDNTLTHYLMERSVDYQKSLDISLSLVGAVERLHKNKIVHGHICSANIYFDEDRVYLLDLAIAHLLVKADKNIFQYDLNTFAPEILNGIQFEAKSDIYGIGLVFKEIVASLDRSAANDANSLRVMRTLEELANLVLVIDPYKRPSLDIIKAALSNLKSEFNLFHESPTRVSISKGLKVSEFLLQERQNQNLIKSDNVNVRVDIENDKNQNIETVAEVKTEKKQDNKLSSVLVFISGILLFFLWQYRLNSVNEYATIESGDYERYAADWNSKIPSRMLPVALAALNATNPDKSAETVIISASRKDETSISGINNSLIKFAFNDKWEMDLTAQDRRAALFLGLGSLLKNKKIENLPELVDLHPGIILAIISSINNKGESVPQNFQNIPAARLLSLPKIYTQGIRVLLENNQNLNCADKDLQQLIYFMVRGIDIDQLNVFLSNNTKLKLQALNEALSSDENKAQLSLELILRNTLLANIKDESIDWARAFNLLDWKELKATEKLSLLAGRIPKSIISEQNVAKLVTHPALIIRSYAFSLIPTAMKLQHPASLDILQKLQNKPDIISPDQSLQLFRILVNPSKIDPLDIKIWIESTPSIEILESLLLSSAAEIEATPVDTAVAASLKNRAWSPSLDVLRKLSVHPDKFTRMYCYNLIFNLTDKETARELLNIAHNKEKEADYKSQLEEMLSNLSN